MSKNNLISFFVLCFVNLFLHVDIGLGNPNKGDVKIKVFRLNDKKEVPQKELNAEDGLFFCCEGGNGDDLGRIEVSTKSEATITIQIENNETKQVVLSGSEWLSNYDKSKVTFNVYPWVQTCDYGDPGLTVKVFSNDEPILQFKYHSSVCD